MGKYLPGGSEQNHPRRPLPRAVATAAVDPPPRAHSSVHPEPSRDWIRWPRALSLPSRSSLSLSRSELPTRRNPNFTAPLSELRSAIAGAPSRHC